MTLASNFASYIQQITLEGPIVFSGFVEILSRIHLTVHKRSLSETPAEVVGANPESVATAGVTAEWNTPKGLAPNC